MLSPASEILRIIIAAHLAFILLLASRDFRKTRGFFATALFNITIIGYLLAPVLHRHEAEAVLYFPVLIGAILVPAAFWHLARLHFDDDYRPGLGTAAVFVAVPAANLLSWFAAGTGVLSYLFALAPKAIAAGIIAHALAVLYSGSKTDLLEPRLRLR
jgi:hypothetical protein